MTTHAWPTLARTAPGAMTWKLKSNTRSSQSPFSGSIQTREIPGARWMVSFTMEDLDEEDAAPLQAFLAKLRGRSGRFYLHNFARPTPRGTIAGTPLVKGAAQTGTSLNIDGCTVGTTLVPGDFFGVNGELKMVVATATADGSGEMTVVFEPPLRAAPADNAAIVTDKPTATFMLTNDETTWSVKAPLFTSIPFDCVEVWS